MFSPHTGNIQLTKDPKKEEKGKQKQKENQKKKPVRHYTGCLVAGSF